MFKFTRHSIFLSFLICPGRKVANAEDERSFSNDPEFYCDIGPGFIITRHALQHLCPRLIVCQREYISINVPTGLQLARCILRFLNETCKSPGHVSKIADDFESYICHIHCSFMIDTLT